MFSISGTDIMTKTQAEIQRQLEALSRNYAHRLPAQLAEIQSEWRCSQHDCENPHALATMHRIVHTVAGSGATFGFPRVSDTARKLNLLLENAIAGKIPIDSEFRDKVGVLLAELTRVVPQPPRAPAFVTK